MVVTVIGANTPPTAEDVLIKDIVSTGFNLRGVRSTFQAGTETIKGYSWYSPNFGSTQVHLNQDTGFSDINYEVLGDDSKRELVQVYIDVFCPANRMRDVTREIDRLIWEAGGNSPVKQQIAEFEETNVYWIVEQKRDIRDSVAHISGTIVCVIYKQKSD